MYRAGHMIRRSSVRIKSLSGGHSHLLMIISQIREVRATFKAFLAAQAILSEDLVKWSCSIDNEAIRETFTYLSELSSLWTEVQKDFVDNMKHFRSNFDMILEGEKHVDQAKQTYSSREEAERDVRKELQKAYKKSPTDEIQVLRERLNKSEKSKELAHMEVVDRIRENEAIRMIRVKEGMRKYGESYLEMIHKANAIFCAQQKVVAEVPDVHDKALHSMKYRGHVCAEYVKEAKEQTRLCRRVSLPTEGAENTKTFFDPPPPYSPSSDSMNDLSRNLSSTSLSDVDKSASSLHLQNDPTAPVSPFRRAYPSLDSSIGDLPSPSTSNHLNCSLEVNGNVEEASRRSRLSTTSLPETKLPLLPLKATRLKRRLSRKKSPSPSSEGAKRSASEDVSTPPNNLNEDGANTPPPYNPFYEWSAFPPEQNAPK